MNRLVVHQSKAVEQPVKPHVVRRAIRYRAADNARAAIRRQYPGMFAPQAAVSREAVRHA